jgi:hypothetical protein
MLKNKLSRAVEGGGWVLHQLSLQAKLDLKLGLKLATNI